MQGAHNAGLPGRLGGDPMKTVLSLVSLVVLAALLAAGCGSDSSKGSGSTTQAQTVDEAPVAPSPAGASARDCADREDSVEALRVTGVDCDTGQAVAAEWSGKAGCASPAGSSRFACSVRGYRCLGAAAERGIAVSCAQRGRSIAFVARRG